VAVEGLGGERGEEESVEADLDGLRGGG